MLNKRERNNKMNIEIINVTNEDELVICSSLRKKVFGDEENAPEALYIIDEYDHQKDTKNYILKVDDTPVATVRFIKLDDDTIKLQRLVVLKEHRGSGYAQKLLKYLENDASSLGYKKIVMDSALKAVGFYEKNNYQKVSDVFYEDNRPHVKMEKALISPTK